MDESESNGAGVCTSTVPLKNYLRCHFDFKNMFIRLIFKHKSHFLLGAIMCLPLDRLPAVQNLLAAILSIVIDLYACPENIFQ
ncbi:hypothetical protein SAMN05216302_1004123 [Nitrosomonas aestuarii]|uniref:Uncharacterized protein n=1 Tax=Nitrosomonas aestuarii TaxID=52441 RepID=A0A1I3YT48_9PROT|nr:hypothetical protein [Nitrosomonas aestuarii]SFK34529.1 hypothetical protein SAMN05216302_1004123 [Nitrosomonas aestuarii]